MVPWLGRHPAFPPLDAALKRPNGLLAAGGQLSAIWLLEAYRRGIFPWYGEGDPILWWSPDPRMVLFPAELRVSRSLRKTLRRGGFRVTADTCFAAVVRACAAPRPGQDGTWIDQRIIDAYTALHLRGYAHSLETWIDGELAGGLYGVAIGRMFYGESMFARATDASKIAFVHLVRQLERWGYGLIDCQMRTDHLASLGAREVARDDFARRLEQLVNYPVKPHPWTLDDDLDG